MQSLDAVAERDEKTLVEQAAVILSRDVQSWIINGDIGWVPNEVLQWFADYMKAESHVHAKDSRDQDAHRCRSFRAKAEAEISLRRGAPN